jgi:putative oxidoreductase
VDADLVVWVLQALLALAFAAAGVQHALLYDRMTAQPQTVWATAVGRGRLRVFGVLEVLGAIGVVLPGLTGVLPWLVPTAAACLAVVMLFAAIFHLRRPGEVPNVAFNAALGILALAVAIGRVAIAPL